MPTKKKTTKKKAAKKKTTRAKSKPKAITIDPGLLFELLDSIVLDGEPEHVARREHDKRHGAIVVDAHIVELRTRIAESSKYDRDVEVGASIARLRSIMSRAINVGDFTVAIAAQKELAKMLSLYPEGNNTGSRAENASDQNIIDQIEAHLRPLGLAKAEYPIEGIARIAADTIRRLESLGV